jgi:hypothetical protein
MDGRQLRRPRRFVAATIIAAGCVVPAGAAAEAQTATRSTVPQLVKAMAPAVVFIGKADSRGEVTSIGSGFVTAVHIRLTTGTNDNFIAINDQLQCVEPDAVLIAILKFKR